MRGNTVRQRSTIRAMMALGMGVSLALMACQSDREATKPDPVTVTDQLLQSALLTVEDLPTGWVADATPLPINTEVVPGSPCDDALTKLEPKTSASADFIAAPSHLRNALAYFPDQGSAVEQTLINVAESCRELVLPDGASVRSAALDFGVLSDRTLGIRFEFEPKTGPIQEIDLILIRDGDLVSLVRLDGIRPTDKELLDSIVRTAIGRLSAVAAQI